MNETKQKILDKSLILFNKSGISNISLRDISDELGISVGNLQYHFNKRDDIIEAHYFQLVEKIENIDFNPNDDLLRAFFNISIEMFIILYEYNFFLLEFVMITRNNQKIKTHYAELTKKREKEALDVICILIDQCIFRKEELKNEYHNLYKRVEVITNFWFSSILIQADGLTKESIKEYSLLISQSIYPYLTDDAKNQYSNIFPSQML